MIANPQEITKLEQLEAYRRLGLAILEQAVLDIKMCKRARVILDGKPLKKWPTKREPTPENNYTSGRLRVCNHFDSPTRVQELVEWIYSESCKTLIELVGAPIEQEHLINLLTESQSDYRINSIQRTV